MFLTFRAPWQSFTQGQFTLPYTVLKTRSNVSTFSSPVFCGHPVAATILPSCFTGNPTTFTSLHQNGFQTSFSLFIKYFIYVFPLANAAVRLQPECMVEQGTPVGPRTDALLEMPNWCWSRGGCRQLPVPEDGRKWVCRAPVKDEERRSVPTCPAEPCCQLGKG